MTLKLNFPYLDQLKTDYIFSEEDYSLPESFNIIDLSWKSYDINEWIPIDRRHDFFAYTPPFKFLNENAITILREIIQKNSENIRSNHRIKNCLRGLAYTSDYIRKFNYNTKILHFVSNVIGEEIIPHNMVSNHGHVNIGFPGNNIPVDEWHYDSVDYVLIVMLSNLGIDHIGGDLEFIKLEKNEALKHLNENNGTVNPSLLETFKNLQQGDAIIMKGSAILHHVTPLLKSLENRITIVNSYQPRNPFSKDMTLLGTFLSDGERGKDEYLRMNCYKTILRMKKILDMSESFNDKYEVFKDTVNVINHSASLLNGEINDLPEIYRELPETSVPIISMKNNDFDKKFIDALCNIGFVQIIDHGFTVPTKELLNFFNFNLDEKKLGKYGNWFNSVGTAPKEGIEWKDKFIYNKEDYTIEEFNWYSEMSYYQTSLEILGKKLLYIISNRLDLDIDFTEEYSSTLRLLKYDKLINNDILSCKSHTDSGWLTILWQNNSGLEVQIEDNNILKWVPIPVIAGGFIINIGDALQLISKNKLKATFHKVINVNVDNFRYSVPYFIEPKNDFKLLDPNDGIISYDKWLINKFNRANFVEYLNSN